MRHVDTIPEMEVGWMKKENGGGVEFNYDIFYELL
jgi:hypothetical protein